MTDISDAGNVSIVDLVLFTECWQWKPLRRISKGRRMNKDPGKTADDHGEGHVENPNASVYVNLTDKPNYVQLGSKRNNAYGARC